MWIAEAHIQFLTIALVVLGSLAVLHVLVMLVASFVSVRPPRIPLLLSPAMLGDPQETLDIQTDDGLNLRGWWCEGGDDWVVVCTHGYFANRSELVPYGPRLRQSGPSLMFFDFRCHGTSQRAKCTFGIEEVRDLKAAIDLARARKPHAKVAVFGSSMGAACAARTATQYPGLIDLLVLDGAYNRLDEAATGFWYVTNMKPLARYLKPVAWFGRLWAGFDPRKIDMVPVYRQLDGLPTLFLYGAADPVVPLESARQCVEAAGRETKVVWFEGCGHSQARYFMADEYYRSIHEFLASQGVFSDRTQVPSTFLTSSSV
ncbi:MAG: alpha/beta fold hydrolase [Armatimonadetes bacterium]|nr:alpha/beta fold hydrolase [Armatimonadota bacterium]